MRNPPAEAKKAPSPVLICGLPRTGTSLLLALLDGHPQLAVASHESKFFLYFHAQAAKLDAAGRLDLAKRTLFSVYTDRGPYWKDYLSHIDPDDLLDHFEKRLPAEPSLGDYLETSVLAYADLSEQISPETLHWVEKTPYTERNREELLSWWPKTKFIHMVRDPRDLLFTYQSRDRKRGRSVSSAAAAATVWRESTALALEGRKALGEDRYLVLRYEDLVQDPASQLRRVVAFLGIEDDEILTVPTRAAGKNQWGGNAIGRQFSGIESSQVGRWREGVEPALASRMEAYCWRPMAQMGYQTEVLRTGFAGRWLAEGWLKLRGGLSRFRRRLREAKA